MLTNFKSLIRYFLFNWRFWWPHTRDLAAKWYDKQLRCFHAHAAILPCLVLSGLPNAHLWQVIGENALTQFFCASALRTITYWHFLSHTGTDLYGRSDIRLLLNHWNGAIVTYAGGGVSTFFVSMTCGYGVFAGLSSGDVWDMTVEYAGGPSPRSIADPGSWELFVNEKFSTPLL